MIEGGATGEHDAMLASRATCTTTSLHPANRRHSPIVGSMLAHHLRRSANIVPTMGECLMFAGQ